MRTKAQSALITSCRKSCSRNEVTELILHATRMGDLSCKHSDHQRNIQKCSWLLTHTAVPSMLPPNSTSTLRQYKELYKGLSANRRSRAKNWWKSGSQTPLRHIPCIHMTVAFHLSMSMGWLIMEAPSVQYYGSCFISVTRELASIEMW